MSRIKEINEDYKKIKEMIKPFFEYDTENKVNWWIETPNPNFGNISPIYLIMIGKANKVIQFIESAKEGY